MIPDLRPNVPRMLVQLVLTGAVLLAQAGSPVRMDLFRPVPRSAATDALWRDACRAAAVLRYDTLAAMDLLRERPQALRIAIPGADGPLLVDLERSNAVSADLQVRTAREGVVTYAAGLHYQGAAVDAPGVRVALSLFANEAMALILDPSGAQVLGRFERAAPGLLVRYREADLLRPFNFTCATVNTGSDEAPHGGGDAADRTVRCVRWYWELAYDIYQNKGSVVNAVNYATGLFNQSALIFANDGVDVVLNEVFVWNTPSPYNGTSSSARLSQFGATRTSFNGDMAHLLDYGGYGGVAWLSTLCSGTSSRMAYSGINSSYNNVPTYSWSVLVVTHEQGHNLGSPHTHACSWNGNGTAIDGCGPTAGYTEGSCPNAGLPAGGGTIMSYCHLVGGTGINFNFGFGPQPKARIIDRVNSATCLNTCGTSCDAPGNLATTFLTPVSATLNWANVGAVSYTVRWKEQAGATWSSVAGITITSHAITGLVQGTAYEFQVLSQCAAGTSGYSPSAVFTTPLPCADALEPNNTVATPADITLPATVSAILASGSDQDHYRFTLLSTSTVMLSLGNLFANYDLYLLTAGGSVVTSSTNAGTTSEFINQSLAAGTYVVRVASADGSVNALMCYNLSAYAYQTTSCAVSGLSTTDVVWNGATLNWSPVVNASAYDIQWKPAAAATWNTIAGVTGTAYVLTGLNGATAYQWRIKANCAGSQSNYGEPQGFTTPSAPCEVQPPVLVSARALLEGPYQQANGLMVDSLRRQGVLPLNEPYTALGLPVTGQNATTTGVLAVTGGNAIVDWVLVELRDAATGASVIERKAALLQRDGDVVAVDGVNPLGFCSAAGTYRIAVRHRNHLGCMTAAGLALSAVATSVDLTSAALGTYGTEARKALGGVQVLWAGNTTGDVDLKYTGSGNDRDPVLVAVGSATPNNVAAGYLRTDVNMDGVARYLGSGNDRDPILQNVGSTTPNNVRVEQLP